MTLPTFEEIESLHRKYAASEDDFNIVFTHSKIVREIAIALLDAKPHSTVDRDFIEAACLLHDIGVYVIFGAPQNTKSYITHGIEGYEILKAEGFDEKLCRIASHHTGVGLSREEIVSNNLPLPHQDFFAETEVERLVMYADKFHSKTPKFNSFDSYLEQTMQFGADNEVKFKALAKEFGVPELEGLSKKYGHPLV